MSARDAPTNPDQHQLAAAWAAQLDWERHLRHCFCSPASSDIPAEQHTECQRTWDRRCEARRAIGVME